MPLHKWLAVYRNLVDEILSCSTADEINNIGSLSSEAFNTKFYFSISDFQNAISSCNVYGAYVKFLLA
ncbi:MAG: hypothetical protein ABIO44_07445 [Saprospiraceae bacterium]